MVTLKSSHVMASAEHKSEFKLANVSQVKN